MFQISSSMKVKSSHVPLRRLVEVLPDMRESINFCDKCRRHAGQVRGVCLSQNVVKFLLLQLHVLVDMRDDKFNDAIFFHIVNQVSLRCLKHGFVSRVLLQFLDGQSVAQSVVQSVAFPVAITAPPGHTAPKLHCSFFQLKFFPLLICRENETATTNHAWRTFHHNNTTPPPGVSVCQSA